MGGDERGRGGSGKMSRFLTRLVLEAASDQDDGRWVLVQPLAYESDDAKRTITVPVGFQTDLASVPRMPVIYWLAGDTSSAAAVVHDYLYSTGLVPRALADAVLREASMVTGVPRWRRWIMWAGVRIGGARHYTALPAGATAA
jgi:hypothetical protein